MFDGDPSALKPTPNQMRSGTSFEAVPPKEHRGVKVGPRRFRQRVASVLVKADKPAHCFRKCPCGEASLPMLRLTAAAVAEPISQSPNSAGGRKGPRRNPGPYFL